MGSSDSKGKVEDRKKIGYTIIQREAIEGESAIYRNPVAKNGLITSPDPGFKIQRKIDFFIFLSL